MKKAMFVVLLMLVGSLTLTAEEMFESKIIRKEIQEVYGNGTLSASTTVYNIVVLKKDIKQYMKIELSKEAFESLHVGDLVRITFDKGFFDAITIKGIKLLEAAAAATTP